MALAFDEKIAAIPSGLSHEIGHVAVVREGAALRGGPDEELTEVAQEVPEGKDLVDEPVVLLEEFLVEARVAPQPGQRQQHMGRFLAAVDERLEGV